MGGLIGGYVGDTAAKRWPRHGRIAVTQFSVSIGIPFACLVFKVGVGGWGRGLALRCYWGLAPGAGMLMAASQPSAHAETGSAVGG